MDAHDMAVNALQLEQTASFLAVAAASCVVYDHIITLDQEIDLVWKRRKFCAVQVLFVLNRYLGMTLQLQDAALYKHLWVFALLLLLLHCSILTRCDLSVGYTVMAYVGTAVAFLMQGIMIFRVSSMYNHDRKIIRVLMWAFIFEIIFVFIFTTVGYFLRIALPDPVSPLGIHVCSIKYFPRFAFFAWIPIATFEVLVLSLSLRGAIQYHRSARVLSRLSIPPTALTKLVYVLLRDSITFPFIYCSLSLLNLTIALSISLVSAHSLFPISSFAPCIIGPRLILNLREAYYLPFMDECSDIQISEGFEGWETVSLNTKIEQNHTRNPNSLARL